MVHPSFVIETEVAQTLVAIYETHSFTRAADRIGRTPSAVSVQVKKLETVLERELFTRHGRSVTPTPDGDVLCGYARRMLALNAEAIAHFATSSMEGRIVFGAPDDIGHIAIPQILQRFAATHPQVEIDVRLRTSDELRRLLDDGRLDLAVVSCEHYGARDYKVIHTEELVWAGLKHGYAVEREPLPLALARTGCAWRERALKALEKAGRSFRIAYSSEHTQPQIAAVLADLAIAVLPESHVAPPLRRLGVDEGLPPLARYEVALLKREDPSEAVEALAEVVANSFADGTWSDTSPLTAA
ncbi:Bacterial regulatory protein LysR, HTH motif:LysR substrate binding domain [Fulvimarina pelagi HTCC2506]|uniref:Bacterial regulatory protein LysR, HTH motif:LysR substrate binding domain n=1 Tax=Fulvimarina pelagi HTCC2506 TaxID=314231 RepID=Q0G7K6_9HYPH|nr:LysR substrate-binding domain-containing protein [Fulvimarina pelagi]EAU42358.1 Bacterial regulatory protein LysR, HTH motif:LysR substrate binding domain [Fulvimarina pelagi HTCC2506]